MSILDGLAEYHEIELTYELVTDCFAELIRRLHQKSGKRVVVLVDEYDKPIFDIFFLPCFNRL